MRINKYIAQATGLSRRAADAAIQTGRVQVHDQLPTSGQDITEGDIVKLDGVIITADRPTITIVFHKPMGCVVSRNGQGSRTIYDVLPSDVQLLNPIGRLDKDSSGLLLLTNDGDLAQQLTHPSHHKRKVYNIYLDKQLQPLHHQLINDRGITLQDGVSRLQLEKIDDNGLQWQVTMHEGRNRQIRRTFASLGYEVTRLHRIQFGEYQLADIAAGDFLNISL